MQVGFQRVDEVLCRGALTNSAYSCDAEAELPEGLVAAGAEVHARRQGDHERQAPLGAG